MQHDAFDFDCKALFLNLFFSVIKRKIKEEWEEQQRKEREVAQQKQQEKREREVIPGGGRICMFYVL